MPDKTKRPKAPGYSKKSPSTAHNRHPSMKRGKAQASGKNKNHTSFFLKLLDFFKL